jgi:hypothetical protein
MRCTGRVGQGKRERVWDLQNHPLCMCHNCVGTVLLEFSCISYTDDRQCSIHVKERSGAITSFGLH